MVSEDGRFLVSRPQRDSGLGSNLASLAGAVWVAARLRRTLVVDWRGMLELQDRSLNYFSEFFETPEQICGVATRYAVDDGRAAESASISPDVIAVSARDGIDPEPQCAVLELYHGLDRIDGTGSAAAHHAFLRRFYREIRPRERTRAALERWRSENFGERFVVGVNIRTGNGQFVRGSPYYRRVDPRVVANTGALVRKLTAAANRAVSNLPKALREDSSTFYVTDSYEMHAALADLPRAITRRTVFPPAGAGHQYAAFSPEDHGEYSDRSSIEDTIVDMFLLADCNALVFNPTMFNQYARVTTNYFGGNLVNIESQYVRRRLLWARTLAGRTLRRSL